MDVEAIGVDDAKLVAMAELRKTPDGTVMANRAEFVEAELTWRDPQ